MSSLRTGSGHIYLLGFQQSCKIALLVQTIEVRTLRYPIKALPIKAVALILACQCALGVSQSAVAEESRYFPSKIELYTTGVEQADPPSAQQIVQNKTFWVFPGISQATIETGQFLQYMRLADHETVLDVGTGTGVLSVFAAKYSKRILATDIDPLAVQNAQYNVKLHGLNHIIEVRQSDLFSSLRPDEIFDVILFNVGDPGLNNAKSFWKLHERFYSQAGKHLKHNGRIYAHSGYIKYAGRMQDIAARYGLKIIEMHMWTGQTASQEPLLLVLTKQPLTKPIASKSSHSAQ